MEVKNKREVFLKMKKILAVLVLLFLTSNALAQLGELTYTQQQIDSINTASIGAAFLKCRMESNESVLFGQKNDQNYSIPFSCLYLMKQGQEYSTVRMFYPASINVNDFLSCIVQDNLQDCIATYTIYLFGVLDVVLSDTKSIIESYQTSHANRIVITSFEDFNYFR